MPRPSRNALAASLMLVPFILAACSPAGIPAPGTGSPAPTALPTQRPEPTPSPAPTAAPPTVLLEVSSEGGFINPIAHLGALPTVVVYTDGRILTQAPPPASPPDALLPRVSILDVGADGEAAILAAIDAAGLDRPTDADPGVVADAGVTVFEVTIDGTTVVTRFAAGGPGGPGIAGGPGTPGGAPGSDGSNGEKAAALDLLGRLLDPTDTWGSPGVTSTIYAPLGFRVWVAPGAPPADASSPAPSIDWPLVADLATFGTPAVPDLGLTGLRSGVVLGADAATLGPILAAASHGTTFTSGGAAYTLYARPLLPHELPG